MGTPHAILRNTQLNAKDSGISELSNVPLGLTNSDYNTNGRGLIIIYFNN